MSTVTLTARNVARLAAGERRAEAWRHHLVRELTRRDDGHGDQRRVLSYHSRSQRAD